MCGIAGILARDGRRVGVEDIDSMVSTMRHRGPDARGARVYDSWAGLGHARLSILDLRPEANQPFETEDGELAITFNGEVFNYVELRSELEALGHCFRTNGDTEVVLRAYRQWGASAVDRFNGMWAFAILDRRRRQLFCSRDRFGIKPFVYARVGGRFIFASEVKALLAVAPELARPNFEEIWTLLRSTRRHWAAETCFAGVHRLKPAHNLLASAKGESVVRYWDYPVEADGDASLEQSAEELRTLLLDAIQLRMRSDVPVGSTLSSGLDSSSIVFLLRHFYHGEHDTFSASYDEGVSEAEAAREVSLSLGMRPNAVPAFSGDFLETLRKCVWHLESPSRTPAVIPLWNIMAAARERVTVMLEGQGADELLAGYAHQCFVPATLGRLDERRPWQALRELRGHIENLGPLTILLWAARTAFPSGQRVLTAWRGDSAVYAGPLRHGERIRNDDARPEIKDRLNAELRTQHEGQLVALLHYGDAISMAHSIESRLPFMDYRLVEFTFRVPGRLKMRDGLGKWLLRYAVRNDVPDRIRLNRRKLGFVTPIGQWFRDAPEKTVYPILLSDSCRRRGIFSPARLEAALERHRHGRADLSNQIFRWLTTELWFQLFIDGSAAPL